MKLLILLFFVFSFHGDNLATYTITKTNNKIHIDVKIDALDLEKAIGSNDFSISNKTLTDYLSEHMSYRINEQETSFIVNTAKRNHHHVSIKLVINGTFETITDIQIKNELLFDVNSKQANVIELRIDGLIKDFLINKNKSTLNIKLD
tara:strand:- start:2801 stop:3244 length:444 start_codon:yes stop_codon:yes gene_type:complete